MKKFSFTLIAIAAMFVSCSKELDTVSVNEEVEYIEVPVKVLLNNVEFISETPLTKSGDSSNDLYGFSIIENYGQSNQMYYCRAIFDDISLFNTVKFKFRK